MEYEHSTLEQLSTGNHQDKPVTLNEVPTIAYAEQNYIRGLFVRGDKKVVFHMQDNNPRRIGELLRIMNLCSERGIELEFRGRYETGVAGISIGGKKETLDGFVVDELELANFDKIMQS